jgi:Sec-independent protein translocase protein TatA
MDSFFGIGAPELILILVIAGMVMGPERIGRTARWLGRTSSQLQSISRGFIRQLNAELDVDGTDEIKGAWNEMKDLRRQIDNLKGELTSVTHKALNDGKKPLADLKEEVERTIAPPSFWPSAGDDVAVTDCQSESKWQTIRKNE